MERAFFAVFRKSFNDSSGLGAEAEYRRTRKNLSEEQITHLTDSPYQGELAWNKRIAKKVLKISRVKVEDAKAEITVVAKRNVTVNGVPYPYSYAKIVMVGEGSRWKFDSYNDGDVVYRYMPE